MAWGGGKLHKCRVAEINGGLALVLCLSKAIENHVSWLTSPILYLHIDIGHISRASLYTSLVTAGKPKLIIDCLLTFPER